MLRKQTGFYQICFLEIDSFFKNQSLQGSALKGISFKSPGDFPVILVGTITLFKSFILFYRNIIL